MLLLIYVVRTRLGFDGSAKYSFLIRFAFGFVSVPCVSYCRQSRIGSNNENKKMKKATSAVAADEIKIRELEMNVEDVYAVAQSKI